MRSFDLMAFGEVALDVILCGVDQVPRQWSVLGKAKAANLFTAGSAGYVAQCFSKLGGRAAIMGRIGDDNAGRFILEGFKQCGVSTNNLLVEKSVETEISMVVLYNDGNKSSVVSSILPLKLAQFGKKCLTGGRAFHVGGYLLYPNLWRKRILPWIRLAKVEGQLVSMDPQMSATGKWSEPFQGIVEHVDVLLLDEDEAKKISKRERLADAIEKLLKDGASVVAVKAGRQGCILGHDGRMRRIPRFKTKPVSTIGAGDAFDAAFIYGSLQGWPVEKRGQFANVVAAISTTQLGCMTAVPQAQLAERITESYYGHPEVP
jgi:sugar/nucleoside kinase (ribokinase family)